MLRAVARQPAHRVVLAAIRPYSIPTPTHVSPKKLPPPLPPNKKQKVDLRPGPIKPKPPPPTSKIPRSFPQASHGAPPQAKLGAAKEEVLHDIHDAEAHGILTPPPPDANWFKRTLHQAIQLLKFYYRGVKLIFSRRKEIALIQARIKAGGPPLTRAEFRLIETQKDDINKVVPFLIIALILEEVIPVIAIYAPFMLPSTCILPSQRDRIEAKRAEKAAAFTSQYFTTYVDLRRAEQPEGFLPLSSLNNVPSAPIAVCGLLGLSTIGFNVLRIRRIRRHLEFITRDDQLLLRDNKLLSIRELVEALEERGIASLNLSQADAQTRLSRWLDAVKNHSAQVDDNALAHRLFLIISNHS